jgi:nitrile hydratase
MSASHPTSHTAARVRRLEERLIEAGLTDDAELDSIITRLLAAASPLNGARIVARAWGDDDFRVRLLTDANSAFADLGLSMRSGLQEQRLTVVANTETTHNVVVCTLCSCYPIGLLGPSPSWYKSEAYRSRVVRDPRGMLAEFGLHLPDETKIVVHDASAETRYMVLPCRPVDTAGWSEDELVTLVSREGLIGTALV